MISEALEKSWITPEVIVKSLKNLVEILKNENMPAITIEVCYEGDIFNAYIDFNAVKIDSYEVEEQVWEHIRQCNISSETIILLVGKCVLYLEQTNQDIYKLPIPIGLKPIKSGVAFAIDLRVVRKGEEDDANV